MTKRSFEDTYAELVGLTNKFSSKLHDEETISQLSPQSSSDEILALVEEMHTACEELNAQNEQLILSTELVLDQRTTYRNLFEFSPTPFITTNKNCKIQTLNKAAALLLTVDAAFLKGKPLSLYVAKHHRTRFFSLLDDLKADDTIQIECEIDIKPRNQPIVPTILNVCATNEEEYLWTIQDVSLMKELKKTIQYKQVNDFVAALMHDLKVPVIGSNMVLQYLNSTENVEPDELKSNLQLLEKTNKQILDQIESLLEVYELCSAPQSETLARRELESLNMALMLEECLMALHSQAQNKNIIIEKDVQEGTIIEFNKDDMKRLLTRLVDNAIKYSPNDTTIKLNVKAEMDDLHIEVIDQGQGLVEEDLLRLFDRFWQGQSKKVTRSSGLGLYFCKQLAILYGGSIRCDSRKGEGSRFSVVLPLKQDLLVASSDNTEEENEDKNESKADLTKE